MTWLSEWLKSIIMVILLASFVDILLPSQTMQRYVKTVISLFILLTLLHPLFSLLQKQASVDQLLADADSFFQGKSPAAAIPAFSSSSKSQAAGRGQVQLQGANAGMQTLESIQQQADQLKMTQEKRSQQLLEQQITTLMKQNIEQDLAFTVQSLNVETGKGESGQMQILAIHLKAAQRNEAVSPKQGDQKLKALQVEPVKPVNISIQVDTDWVDRSQRTAADGSLTASSPAAGAAKATPSPGSAFEQEKSQIQSLLSKVWQVPKEIIFVEVTKM